MPNKFNHKLSPFEEKWLDDLFKKLDTNDDGKICIDDVTTALGHSGHHEKQEKIGVIAQNFIKRLDKNKDGYVEFHEFVQYVLEHDKKLTIAFKHMDTNEDGHIDAKEIQTSFLRLGIHIESAEAKRLLQRVGNDGTLKINYDEWREFLLLHPTGTLSDIVHYWRHGIFIDSGGESSVIPDDFSTEEKRTGQHLLQLFAGGVAGTVSRTVTAPADRLKVLLQVHGYKHKNSGLFGSCKYMLTEGGFLSLWRGNGINVLKIAPESALKYACYERYKQLLSHWATPDSWLAEHPLLHKFIAGSLAGSTAQSIIYPMEVLKTRMCLRKTDQFTSIADCAMKVYKEGGMRAFYRGYLINLYGIVPYAGIELGLYEKCKSLYASYAPPASPNEPNHPPPLLIPAMAAGSSVCGMLVTYPLALIRTKLQSKSAFRLEQLDSPWALFLTILQEDGPRGLYRGLVPNLIKVLPAVGISYSTYELLNRELGLRSLGS